MIYNLLQLLGGLILAIGYWPQLVQIKKTESVEDLNLKTFSSIFIGVAMMEIYACNLVFNGSGLMFLITNSMSLMLAGIMVLLILKYRNKNLR